MSVCSVLIIYFGILAFYKILKYIAMYCNIYRKSEYMLSLMYSQGGHEAPSLVWTMPGFGVHRLPGCLLGLVA